FSFDNSSGFQSTVAIANSSANSVSLAATVWDESGNASPGPAVVVPGNGHVAFALADRVPATAGKRGLVRFQGPSGSGIAGLALRFSASGAFVWLPGM